MRTTVHAAVFALVTGLVIGCAAEKREGVLRVATEAAYRPFESVAADGSLEGFDIDLIRAVGREAGLEVELSNQAFVAIIPGLESGRFDAAISAMTITPERAERVAFTRPYFKGGLVIAVRADESDIRGVDDLPGRTLAVQLGTTGFLRAGEVPDADVKSFDSIEPAFLELARGGADAVINDEVQTRLYLAGRPEFRVLDGRLSEEEYGIAVRRDAPELVARLDAALDRLRASGELDRLHERWFGAK